MGKPSRPDNASATTPEDNNYCPQRSNYHEVYGGDLTVMDTEFEERDTRVDSTRSEFAKTPTSKGIDN